MQSLPFSSSVEATKQSYAALNWLPQTPTRNRVMHGHSSGSCETAAEDAASADDSVEDDAGPVSGNPGSTGRDVSCWEREGDEEDEEGDGEEGAAAAAAVSVSAECCRPGDDDKDEVAAIHRENEKKRERKR